MKSLAAALFCAAILAGPALGLEPVREGQETMIARAVFADGKLWLLSDAGQLFTIVEGRNAREKMDLPGPAVDLWLKDGAPAVVTCSDKSCGSWTLRQWQGGNWHNFGVIAAEKDEQVLATQNANGATLMLTTARVIELKDNVTTGIAIGEGHWPVMGRVGAVLVRPGRILVGTNAGEWGGRLIAIDRKTGGSTDLCDRGGCGPVNGLVEKPGNPGCVLAAVGVVHFGPSGRILEICGVAVRRFYFRNLPCLDLPQGKIDFGCLRDKPDANGETPFHMEAFFGLVRSSDTAWAVGVDGLYRITTNGVERMGGLPKFVNYGGTWVSFAIPGIALVLTEINERHSISGATPMIVPR